MKQGKQEGKLQFPSHSVFEKVYECNIVGGKSCFIDITNGDTILIDLAPFEIKH
jgi:hypothetical protein